jgi:hypothetical protein
MLFSAMKLVKAKWKILVLAGLLALISLVPLAKAALRSSNTRPDAFLGQSKNTPPCPASSAPVGPPKDKNQCKNNGWQAFTVPRCFKNQGDCVSYVNEADHDKHDDKD